MFKYGCEGNTYNGKDDMKQIATTLALILISSVAQAQSCVELCNREWWPSATQPEIEAKIATADINARDESGETALFSAAVYGTPETVAALLAAGADVGARSKRGETALFRAAGFGTPEIIDVLLAAGADGSVSNTDGQTAFDLAQDNYRLKGTDAYWRLNDARFK